MLETHLDPARPEQGGGPAPVPTRADLSTLTVDAKAEDAAAEVVSRLRQWGVAMIPNWLEPDTLGALQTEFDDAFASAGGELEQLTATGKDLSKKYGRTVTGEHLKYSNGTELRAALPASAPVFNNPFMRTVASGYFGSHTLNRHVILTNDHVAHDQIIGYHYDEICALKFLIYLDDVDAENGPFEIIPGTHAQGREIRIREWLRTDEFNALKIRVFEEFSEELFYTLFGQFKPFLSSRSVAAYAPAGSMLVFDTDTIHRAGLLTENRRRRVIRGSTYRGMWP
jgi:hypothetical protein